MKRHRCVVIASIAILAGCVQSSGVLPLGPDTWSLSVHAAPVKGKAGARKAALTEASEFCASKNKHLLVTHVSTDSSGSLPGDNIDLEFRCLNDGDSELQRPVYESKPDVVIQHR